MSIDWLADCSNASAPDTYMVTSMDEIGPVDLLLSVCNGHPFLAEVERIRPLNCRAGGEGSWPSHHDHRQVVPEVGDHAHPWP